MDIDEQNTQSPDGLNWNNGRGLTVYDLSGALASVSPTPPELKATFGWKDAQFIDIEGDSVFMTDSQMGVGVLSINAGADPAAWVFENIFRFPNQTGDIQVASRDGKTYAWVLNDTWVRLLDVTNPIPGNVHELNAYRLPFYTSGVSFSENMPWIWMTAWNNGLSGWWAAPTMDGTVSTPNATLTSNLDGVAYTFANENLRLWHTPVFQGNLPPAPTGLVGINRAFENSVFDPQTELPVTPNGSYTLTITYDPALLGKVAESSLKLFFWNGTVWVEEASTLNATANTLTAHPNHFSVWSVMGAETVSVFLPIVRK